MARLQTALTITLALAVLAPAGANAATGGPPPPGGPRYGFAWCRPAYPALTASLVAYRTSCSTARALERYRVHNEVEVGAWFAGRWWRWSQSYAFGQTTGDFTQAGRLPRPQVTITLRGGAS